MRRGGFFRKTLVLVYGTVAHGKICPYCGSEHTYLLRGNEFILKNITAADDLPEADPAEEPPQETAGQTSEETARDGE